MVILSRSSHTCYLFFATSLPTWVLFECWFCPSVRFSNDSISVSELPYVRLFPYFHTHLRFISRLRLSVSLFKQFSTTLISHTSIWCFATFLYSNATIHLLRQDPPKMTTINDPCIHWARLVPSQILFAYRHQLMVITHTKDVANYNVYLY